MSEEKPLLWHDPDEDKGPVPPEVERYGVREFEKATDRQRGLIIIGLAVMWLLGEIGCLLAGLALHETAHIF
jgi:hypothetical protein